MLTGFDSIQARDLMVGDTVPEGVVVDIETGATGLLTLEVAAYQGSTITNLVTVSPVDTVWVK